MDKLPTQLNVFGLKEQPFAPTADPGYFYATREHKSCLYRLWSSIDERHGIAVVLGNYGTGKTTLLRKLITGMAADPERYNTAVIGSPVPSWTSFALLEAIIQQFRLKPTKRSFAAYMEALNQYLMKGRKRISTLIIDDAQNLNKRGQLELLRLVQNLETPQHKLLNLVLFAQLEWMQVLNAAPNFKQRVNLVYTLESLQVEEVARFIEFRIAQAGGAGPKGPRFEPVAIDMIHAYSDGNPRVIVTVCRNALLSAAQLRQQTIDAEIVLHTLEKTTAPDDEKLERTRAVMHTRRPHVPAQAAPAPERNVLADVSVSNRPMSREDRANQLLMRGARTRR